MKIPTGSGKIRRESNKYLTALELALAVFFVRHRAIKILFMGIPIKLARCYSD